MYSNKGVTQNGNMIDYSVPHEEKQKLCFEILLHISGINCLTVMLQVSL